MSDSFFKYTTLDSALEIIKRNAVQFSRPFFFNDPFDSLVPLRPTYSNIENSKKTMDKYFKNQLSQDFWIPEDLEYTITMLKRGIADPNHKKLSENRKVILKELEENGKVTNPEMIKNLRSSLTEKIKSNNYKYAKESHAIEEDVQRNIQSIADNHFIFCASEIKNSILMWSHYSEEHTGIVLEFSKLQNSFFKNLKKVKYTEERPALDNNIFYCKAKCWDYEKELRCVIHANDYNISSNQATAFISYTQNDLLSVYFGCNIKDTHKEKVNTLMKEARELNPNITFYKMQTDTTKYKLNSCPTNI